MKTQQDIVKKIPNILTNLRIIFVPIICLMIYVEYHNICGITSLKYVIVALTALVCLTDCLDGKIARKYNVITPYGKCMDPIADKLLVLSLIMMLLYTHKVWLLPALIILFREIFISGVREFCSREKQISIPVSKMAKYKTILQMTSLVFLLAFDKKCVIFYANVLFSISALLAVITAIHYIKSVYWILNGENLNSNK